MNSISWVRCASGNVSYCGDLNKCLVWEKKCFFFHQISVIKTGPNKGTVCSSLRKCQRTVITYHGTSKHLKGRSVSNGFASQRIWLFSCFETLSVLVLCPLRVTVFASQRIFSFSCFYTFKSVWKQENDKVPIIQVTIFLSPVSKRFPYFKGFFVFLFPNTFGKG